MKMERIAYRLEVLKLRILKFIKKRKMPLHTYFNAHKGKYTDLKLEWAEKVDSKNKNGIVNLYNTNINYCSLPIAFIKFDSKKEVDMVDLNKEVKTMLKEKLREFHKWRKRLR